MTTEQYTQLIPFEIILYRAHYGNYVACTRKEFEAIISIDSHNFIDYQLSKSAYNCGKCRLRELRRISKNYFDIKNKLMEKCQ